MQSSPPITTHPLQQPSTRTRKGSPLIPYGQRPQWTSSKQGTNRSMPNHRRRNLMDIECYGLKWTTSPCLANTSPIAPNQLKLETLMQKIPGKGNARSREWKRHWPSRDYLNCTRNWSGDHKYASRKRTKAKGKPFCNLILPNSTPSTKPKQKLNSP